MTRWFFPSLLVLFGSAAGLNFFAARSGAMKRPAARGAAVSSAGGAPAPARAEAVAPSYDKIIPATDAPFLQVVLASPEGALTTPSQASEIRWMFDRPVVELTAIAQREDPANFVTAEPRLEGTFRWASTRMLIFTAKNLKLSTRYRVALAGLTALDGKKLQKPFTLEFETPRVKCALRGSADGWSDARDDSQIAVRCDQPVSGPDLAARTRVVFHTLQLDAAPYTPSQSDFARLEQAEPETAKRLARTLEQLSRPPAALPERATRFVRTGPCPNDRDAICHYLAVPGDLPLDAAAQIRYLDGIRSELGPLASQRLADDHLETPKTPLIRTRVCRPEPERCNPEEGFAIEERGVRAGRGGAGWAGRVTVRDLTDPERPPVAYRPPKKIVRPGRGADDRAELEYETQAREEDRWNSARDLRWVGLLAGHDYEIEYAPELTAFGRRAGGYRLFTTLRLGNMPAYARMRGGERVLERGFAAGVKVRLRNVSELERVRARIEKPALIALIRRYDKRGERRNGSGIDYAGYRPEKIAVPMQLNLPQAQTLGLTDLPGFAKGGIFLLAARPTRYAPHSAYSANGEAEEEPTHDREGDQGWTTSLLQFTDLAVTIKHSPRNSLVSVTSLKNGAPIANAAVDLYDLRGGDAPFWRGTTDRDGLARGDGHCRACTIVAVAQLGDELAYTQSGWRDSGYDYYDDEGDAAYDAAAGSDREIGELFTDRGVYKPGEVVHFKGLLRNQKARSLEFPASRELAVVVTDPRDGKAVELKTAMSGTGAFDGSFTLPAEAVMGTWRIAAGPLSADFLMTSYRRPEFKVDTAIDKPAYIAGDTITGTVRGNYLFGAPMEKREVAWAATAWRESFDPAAGHPELGLDGYRWEYWCAWWISRDCDWRSPLESPANAKGELDAEGLVRPRVASRVSAKAHLPARVTLEGTVTDVNRQEIANRASVIVHPGEFYVGLKVSNRFSEAAQTIRGAAVAVAPDGRWKPGERLTARLLRWEWVAAARKTGDESATRSGAWRFIEVASQPLTSANHPVEFAMTPDRPGYYEVSVLGKDARGNWLEAGADAYVIGDGYVAWRDTGDDSLELLPERERYAPGEKAKVLVQSPWAEAEGLLTLEREEVITARRFHLKGGASVVEVPIESDQTPNVFVSVTLFKGRTAKPAPGLPDDPGRPQVKSGTVELKVPPLEKKLSVAVKADAEEYRPGLEATASVAVTGADGKPAPSEVTLWAVDEGVLRLTGYELPDLVASFYPRRAHLVITADGRMKLAPVTEDEEKGAPAAGAPAAMAMADGGGGGVDENGAKIRTDFRILALWQGTVATDAQGRASVKFKLPESLTSYRIMAVAAGGTDRFGGGEANLRIKKPFMVLPAVPRFLNLDDRVEAGAVLHNQTGKPGTATLKLKLPDHSPLAAEGPLEQTINLPPGPTEVRFALRANSLGRATLVLSGLFTASGAKETDAVQAAIPVTITRRTETVAAAGQVDGGKVETEKLRLPADIYPTVGGLDMQLSSSALAGLQNGVDELVEYPYGCLEQRSSRARVLLMLERLAADYPLPSLKGKKLREAVQAELDRVPDYLTPDGGLGYWEGGRWADEYLTARVLILLLDARDLGYRIPEGLVDTVVNYMQTRLRRAQERGEWDPAPGYREKDGVVRPDDFRRTGFWFSRAHFLYALARAGRPEPALDEFLWARRGTLPILEQIHLLHAMALSGQTGEKPARLYRELLNYLRVEADRAFVQNDLQYDDAWCPCLNYLFAGDTHNTAALLSLMLKVDPREPLAARMARALLAQRRRGVWLNTLEDGYALTALVEFAKTQEAAPPDFTGEIVMGAQVLFSERFSGRELTVRSAGKPMGELSATLKTDGAVPLSFAAKGTGRLYYAARLKYAPLLHTLPALDAGFTVQREYRVRGEAGARVNFKAGDLVTVRLRVTTAQVRHQVVIDDALPAGLEPLNAALQTTSRENLAAGGANRQPDRGSDGESLGWWLGVDHVEIHDERVLHFASTLAPGTLEYNYVARATAPGSFIAPPTQAEEMYRPEIFGRSGFATVTVSPPGR